MRTNYIPALVAMLVLASPLCARMQQSGYPSGTAPYPPYSAHPQATAPYAPHPQAAAPYAPHPQAAAPYAPHPQAAAPYAAPGQNQPAPLHQFYRGEGPHNGDWLRNTMQLPPREQERKLEQDQRFRQLPPERQAELRNRLARFNSMPPQEQQRVLNRMEMIEHLPPEQQRRAQELFGEFRAMDPQRKDMMRRTLRQMRSMPPDARLRMLNSPETRSLYSSQEIRMLYDFNSIGFVGPQQ